MSMHISKKYINMCVSVSVYICINIKIYVFMYVCT